MESNGFIALLLLSDPLQLLLRTESAMPLLKRGAEGEEGIGHPSTIFESPLVSHSLQNGRHSMSQQSLLVCCVSLDRELFERDYFGLPSMQSSPSSLDDSLV